jgi:uncharacterized phage protein (TIGR02216 family)
VFSEAAARLAGVAGAILGWRPDEFWAATPAELSAVLGALSGAGREPASPTDLAQLMEMYPDG